MQYTHALALCLLIVPGLSVASDINDAPIDANAPDTDAPIDASQIIVDRTEDVDATDDAAYYDAEQHDAADQAGLCQSIKNGVKDGCDATLTFVSDHPYDIAFSSVATTSVAYLAFYAYQYWLSQLDREPSQYERWAMYAACVGVATSTYYAAYRNDLLPNPVPHIAFDFYTNSSAA